MALILKNVPLKLVLIKLKEVVMENMRMVNFVFGVLVVKGKLLVKHLMQLNVLILIWYVKLMEQAVS